MLFFFSADESSVGWKAVGYASEASDLEERNTSHRRKKERIMKKLFFHFIIS